MINVEDVKGVKNLDTSKYQLLHGVIGDGDNVSIGTYKGMLIDLIKRGKTPIKDLIVTNHDAVITRLTTDNQQELDNWLEFISKTYSVK